MIINNTNNKYFINVSKCLASTQCKLIVDTYLPKQANVP